MEDNLTKLKELEASQENQVTPEEAKKKVLADLEKELSSEDPIAMSAKVFGMYLPMFQNKMKSLSRAGVTRVALGIVEFPLGKPFVGITKEEREAFALGNALMDAKFVLIMNEMANKEQAKLENTNGETQNGS